MVEFELPTHQRIAREIFGETEKAYSMEPADVYQALTKAVIGFDTTSSDAQLAFAYNEGYRNQMLDARRGNTMMMELLAAACPLDDKSALGE
ncbi:hypothetical protein H6800_00560 [Candidatus Nomurabacteria bacterium]|nr:hypothetical protein [Candidatus Nomurabacteria bacterium]